MQTPPKQDVRDTGAPMRRALSVSRRLASLLLALGAAATLTSGAAEKSPPAVASVPATTNTAKSLWDRIVMVGASMSAGFTESEPFGGPKTREYRLSRYFDAAVSAPHEPTRNLGSAFIFLQPEVLGRQQIERAVKAEPTLVVGLDFPFWFCYGQGRTDEERLQRFEAGLKLMEAIKCPLVLGDIPDASAAVNGMLRPDQMPSAQAMTSANRRLSEWAATRKHVVIVPLSDFMRAAAANRAIAIHGHTWRDGTTRAFLQDDKLHPTARGCVAITLAALDTLCSRQLGASPTEICWDPEEVRRRGLLIPQNSEGQPHKPPASSAPSGD